LLSISFSFLVSLEPSLQNPPNSTSAALELIRQQRYNDALNILEQVLEATPAQPEALAYLGTVHLYAFHDFLKAQKLFEESFRAGGGATFWVSHSHENLGTGELADYCRGWLHLRKGELEFAPVNEEHGFRLANSEIKEFKQNRAVRRLFHVRSNKKTYDFRPRTGDTREIWLILILYKKFNR
jgi:tetratricopeptide (TPR) repeat protein